MELTPEHVSNVTSSFIYKLIISFKNVRMLSIFMFIHLLTLKYSKVGCQPRCKYDLIFTVIRSPSYILTFWYLHWKLIGYCQIYTKWISFNYINNFLEQYTICLLNRPIELNSLYSIQCIFKILYLWYLESITLEEICDSIFC